MIVADAERWKRLSPLLDGLLDLDPPRRAARLAALREHDPALAAELASLIDDFGRAEETQLLSGRAPGPADLAGFEASSLAGERVGAYLLEAPLGHGGTGAVWRARRVEDRLEGAVAVKLLPSSLIGRIDALRFEREGRVLARLSHPNIARLLDTGVTAGGQPYLVLELVEGEPIDRHCDDRHLDIEARIELFRRVLEAVAHAHRHLVIHRDIKPNDILVGREGDVKLLDFGIAKLVQAEADASAESTGEGGRALTPDYAAPEQLRGEEVTTATDVYSLGVLLYQLLTGRHPTRPARATPADIVRATLEADPSRLSVAVTQGGSTPDEPTLQRLAADRNTSPARLRRQLGGDLESVVAKALRKAPTERYLTVDAFREDLRRWAAGEPVSARADSLAYRTTRLVARHRGAVAAATLTFAAIVAGLIGTISQAHRAQAESERATGEAKTARAERDSALQQQMLLRGTNEFLQLLMRDAAGGDPGAVRKQLDRARTLLAQTRFEQPIVKVELQRQLASRYSELGDLGAATELVRQAIAATQGTELAAPTNAVPVDLACSLSRYLSDANDPAAALGELDRADRLVAAGAVLSVPSQVECRMNRGFAEPALGHYTQGVSATRAALATLEAAGVREGEPHRVVRSALSYALLQAGRNADALAVARPLLAESEAAQGRESIAVLRRSAIVTSITRAGGDPLGALALSERDRETAARLLAGRDDAAIELEHGRILVALGRHAEAAETLARTAKVAQAGGNVAHILALGLAETAALLGDGRSAEAERRFADLKPLRDAAARDGRPEQIESLRLEALLAAAHGDRAASVHSLDAAEHLVEGAGGTAHPMTFAVAYARASFDAEQAVSGSSDEAAAALSTTERALAAARRGALVAERSSDVGRALLLRAQILAAAQRGAESRRDAADAQKQLEATLGATHPSSRAAAALANGSPP